MIKDIVRDILFLQRKAEPATKDDWQVGRDLVDTLESKLDTCAGLAANMIGSTKAVIVFRQGNKSVVMYNPEILKTSPAPYDAEEGCLSLDGRRPCKRYDKIGQVHGFPLQEEDEDLHGIYGRSHPARNRPPAWDFDLK